MKKYLSLLLVVVLVVCAFAEVYATEVPGIKDGDTYYIKNVASGKAITLHAGTDSNGANIYQSTYSSQSAYGGYAYQQFKLDYDVVSKSYRLKSMRSSNGNNRVVSIGKINGNIQSGCNVRLYSLDSTNAADWQFVYVSNGKYKIIPKGYSNLALSVYGTSNGTSNGTTSTSAGNIFISTYTQQDSQHWYLFRVSSFFTINSGHYLIRNKDTGLYLTVNGNSNHTEGVSQAEFTGAHNQQWYITTRGSVGYIIRPFSNLSVAMSTNGAGDANVWIYVENIDFNNVSDKQCWNIVPSAENSNVYRFSSVASNGSRLVSIWENNGNSAFNGSNNSSYSSEWILESINTTTLSADNVSTITVPARSHYVMQFWVPTDERYYTLKATSTSDNALPTSVTAKVYGLTGGVRNFNAEGIGIIGQVNNSDYGRISCVFQNSAYTAQPIEVSLFNQRATIFTYQYSDIDTTSDADVPRNKLSGQYVFTNHVNKNANFLMTEDSTGRIPLNSEILIFASHCNDNGQIMFQDGSLFNFSENIAADLKDVNLALFSCCYSLGDKFDYPVYCIQSSLPDDINNSVGALTSNGGVPNVIGWKRNVNDQTAKSFSDAFFTEASNGKTIRAAFLDALKSILVSIPTESDDGVFLIQKEGHENDRIYLNTNTDSMIIPMTISSEVNSLDTSLLNMFVLEQEEFSFIEVPISANISRFIKTVSGIPTSDVYTVTRNNDKITEIKTATGRTPDITVEIIEELNFPGFSKLDVTGINNLIKEKNGKIIKQVQENYYLVINNILTPVTLVRTDYENSFGALIQDINIYNRLDNSVIPQEDVILFIG